IGASLPLRITPYRMNWGLLATRGGNVARWGVVGRVVIAAALGLGGIAVTMAAPTITEVDAAGCVRITGGVFNSPGNDNYMPYLNQEYVVIKNVCSTSKLMTGWRVNDYGRIHT